VRCGKWHADNVVLMGDAAHTAHFSIGSGTKLAMEDAIALRDELVVLGDRSIPEALAAYEARRRPEVEALQAAAQASLEWFEGTERYLRMAPVELTYSLMTRSLRVSHASVAKRDPHLARGVEQLLAARSGVTTDPPPPPTALPIALGPVRARNRIALAPFCPRDPGDDALVALGAAAASGVGLVVTPVLQAAALATDDAIVAWRRIADYVHGKGARFVLRTAADAESAPLIAERAAFTGFDILVLDSGHDAIESEALPATLAAARTRWPRWLGAHVRDRPSGRAAILGHAAQLVRAGADVLWVSAQSDGSARLPAAPLADRLRNELGVATIVDGADALLSDLDAAIAAGRADLVVVDRIRSTR